MNDHERNELVDRGLEILKERLWGDKYPTTNEWYAVEAEYAQKVSGTDGTDENDPAYASYYEAQKMFIVLVARRMVSTLS